jgi:uncharacterized tellurite resistance protein B-like protein
MVLGDDSVMRRSRALRTMMAHARTILKDGRVSDQEAADFRTWVDTNPDLRGLPQLDELFDLLVNAFADGHLSEAEREQLARVLDRLGG